MPIDEDNFVQEIAEDQHGNIWRTDTTVLGVDTVIERNSFEIATDADRLAWVAIWVSGVVLVGSMVSAAISLSL